MKILVSTLLVALISALAFSGEPASALTAKGERDEFAGAFVPLPTGQLENMPALAHYSGVLAGALGSYGAVLTPGKMCRVRFAGLDEMSAEKVMRVGADQILLTTKSKSIETVN